MTENHLDINISSFRYFPCYCNIHVNYTQSHSLFDSVAYYGGFSGMEQNMRETLFITCCGVQVFMNCE